MKPAFSAVIFDMDGLLVNTEPLWRQAEIECFRKVGREFTDEMCMQTMGLKTNEVIDYWYNIEPWEDLPKKELEVFIITRMGELIREQGEAMLGVIKTLEFLHKLEIPMALASSSPLVLIEEVLRKLQIGKYFSAIASGENHEFGKPHPAIFLDTASKLKMEPSKILVFEDSLMGIIAARAAKMYAIAIPQPECYADQGFAIAHEKFRSLEDIDIPALFTLNTNYEN